MRPAAILTAVAGIGVVVGLISAGSQRLGRTVDPHQTSEPAPDGGQAEGTTAPAPQPTTNPQASMNARPIDAASQFYPAAVDGKPLERVAAPEPEKPKATEEKEGMNLPRPVAESAGVLGFGDRRLQLAGIIPTPADKVCTDPSGVEWPCGMLAKTNFRLFLRLRTVSCDLDSADWSGTVTTSCKIGTQDLSQWLVETGWADAADGSALVEAGTKAKQDQKGLHGEDPRKGVPVPDPIPDEPADPL